MKKLLLIFSVFILSAQTSKAQGCSVCSKTASQLGDKSAKGLNDGIIYLAMLPLALIGTIGVVWWKRNHLK
ncbi:MAG TPA: hypothetical protein PLQ78_05000 [Flavipsychrobacter sp.]|jgi:hypothetical protein|nr:hypothetical protein [Flavipsychrobacter sp.]